jgi:uncharacterized Tic20 family protein
MSDAPIPPYPQQASTVSRTVNSEERNLAMLAHILQIFTGFIGPLIIFFVKRDSNFVRYHSLMALFWQLLVMAFWMAMMVVFFASMFSTILGQAQQIADTPPGTAPPPIVFGVLAIFWGGGMLVWVLNLVLGIVYAIKAHDGKWDGYPVIKSWAAKAAGVS